MNKDVITTYDENNQKDDYKLLAVINKDYKYLIYTKINNTDARKDLYAIKIKELKDTEEIIPITNEEWDMIENTYKTLINE